MISSTDLRDIRRATSDNFEALNALVQQLVGEPFLFFRECYGEELSLHFGTPRQIDLGKFGPESIGSYILTVRASFWIAKTPTSLYASDPLDEHNANQVSFTEFESILDPKTQVVAANAFLSDLGGYGLRLVMDNQLRFMIKPALLENDRDAILPPIADWELFTPSDRYLRVGPGTVWSYLSSDQPADRE